MNIEYKPKASAKVITRYHIVLVTKYRKPALKGIEQATIESLRQAAKHAGIRILSINTGQGTHVHILASIPPTRTISQTISLLKQLSTRKLWQNHEQQLHHHYWGKQRHLWSAGYYCATIGKNNEETITNYIHNQQQA